MSFLVQSDNYMNMFNTHEILDYFVKSPKWSLGNEQNLKLAGVVG